MTALSSTAMDRGIAIRCGACRGRGRLGLWFKGCECCRGRGWFDARSAPGGLGVVVAAADSVRTNACRNLLVRPALPWETFPIPDEIKASPGAPNEATWERAIRGSAVILYEHENKRSELAGGLELARLDDAHALLRKLCWRTLPDGGLWRCVDGRLQDVYLRLSFFRAWRGDWIEITRWEGHSAPEPPPPRLPDTGEARSEANKYVTGKLFVGLPRENE